VTSTRVKHPILRLDVLAPDGTTASEHRVFCRQQHQSVRVEECCECVHCDAVIDGPSPSVECSIPDRPLAPGDDPTGERVEVGTLLRHGTVALSEAAGVGRARGLLCSGDRRSVPIVDASCVLVGLVHDVGAPASDRVDAVSAVMSSALAVLERTPVRVALKLLAASHLREATVVSRQGIPIGVFRDVDGLRWIAGARDAARGEPED
jgi:CBS domain-containing protein